MAAFPGVDFIDFDTLLTDDEKLARQTARQFVDEEILPIIEQHNREGKFPLHLVAAIWRARDFLAPACKAMAARECRTSNMAW